MKIRDGWKKVNEIEGDLPPNLEWKGGIRKGRNVRDGYLRGWGLQFGSLREKVLEDRLYQEACELTVGRSLVAEDKRMNLFLILKYFLPDIPFGHIIEFGSYRGGNALFMGYVVNKLYSGVKVLALDTYTGMPEVDLSLDAHSPGDFRDVDLKEVRTFAGRRGVANVQFIPGLFEETAAGALSLIENVALVHIDCDIYSAVAYSYEIVKDYMVPRGYLIFDDATYSSCLGATEAVEELIIRRDGLHSEQIYPHFVFRAFPP